MVDIHVKLCGLLRSVFCKLYHLHRMGNRVYCIQFNSDRISSNMEVVWSRMHFCELYHCYLFILSAVSLEIGFQITMLPEVLTTCLAFRRLLLEHCSNSWKKSTVQCTYVHRPRECFRQLYEFLLRLNDIEAGYKPNTLCQ